MGVDMGEECDRILFRKSESVGSRRKNMNQVANKIKGKVLKFAKFTVNGNGPADFYVFERGDGDNYRECYWSGWIKGNTSLYYKLKNLEKKDVPAFMALCDELCKIKH
jgi:hypothetical protein